MPEQAVSSDALAQRLLETFAAYKEAERKADEVFLNYKFLRATDHAVQAANRQVAEAQTAHLAAISDVRRGPSIQPDEATP